MPVIIPTYHIIGGGIAGLSCVWFIRNKHPKARVVIYEATSHLGGRAYSYLDETFGRKCDNIAHLIADKDKFMSRFVQKNEWKHKVALLDLNDETVTSLPFSDLLTLRSTQNMPKYSRFNLFSIFRQLKFWRHHKFWISEQNITERILNVLLSKADELHLNYKLKSIVGNKKATQLDFGKQKVDVADKDRVIVALDNIDCAKVLPIELLSSEEIVTIIYQTSQTVFLPDNASALVIKGGVCHKIYVCNGFLTAEIIKDNTYSDTQQLATAVWKEIDKIRGVNSGFMPTYKVAINHRITASNQKKKQPRNAKTAYKNVFIAGDWTMKSQPCTMETATASAWRAVKTALKYKK